MTPAVACYYIMYAARYFQGAVSVLLEHKRKDFWEMQLHHLTTCALVALSYSWGWNRVGLVVMLVLDPADVPLHVAKVGTIESSFVLNEGNKLLFIAHEWCAA